MRTLPPLDRERNEELQRVHRNLDAVARATRAADAAWAELQREHMRDDTARWQPAHEAFARAERLEAEKTRLKALYLQHGGTEANFEERWQQHLDDRAFQAAVEATERAQAQARRQV